MSLGVAVHLSKAAESNKTGLSVPAAGRAAETETRKLNPETRNPQSKTQNLKPETRNATQGEHNAETIKILREMQQSKAPVNFEL